MRRLLLLPALLTTAVLFAFLFVDGLRTAERAGRFEIEARDLRGELAATRERLAAAEQRAAGLQAELARQEGETLRALDNARALGEVLTDQVEQRERAAVAARSAEAATSLPMPLGVQRCLTTLRQCLEAEGHLGLRFLRARAVENKTVCDVEVLDLESDASELLVAAAMTVELDRRRGELDLVFRDGFRRAAGVRAELPETGHRITLRGVLGPMWEERLPYLVRASGEYPPPADAGAAPRPTAMEPAERAVWIERVDALLAIAGTEHRLRLVGFRDLRDGHFLRGRVLGYDQGKLLAMGADVAELAIEVDRAAGMVSLLLRDGVLRQQGGQSTIGKDGYRMLLPDVTPDQAIQTMLGMVVRR